MIDQKRDKRKTSFKVLRQFFSFNTYFYEEKHHFHLEFSLIFLHEPKGPLTPTRNRAYSRVYRQVLSRTNDVELARSESRAECDRLGL